MSNKIRILVIIFGIFPLHLLLAQEINLAEPVRFLSLGDSYTIGASVPTSERWPQQLYDSIANRGYQTESLRIIAQTGWRTGNLIQAIENANLATNFSLVSVLIGVNNQYQGHSVVNYQVEFEDLIKTAIELAEGEKDRVFVLSIPDYAYTPFGENNISEISREIDKFNEANKYISRKYNIKYYDITAISRLGLRFPDLVAGDGLHPSGKMYTEWVNLILNDIPTKTSDSVTGIKTGEENEIRIYPNPVSDRLFIMVDNYDYSGLSVQLIDLTGKIIVDKNFHNSNFSLNLENTSSGLYLLKIVYKEHIIFRKILIQKNPVSY